MQLSQILLEAEPEVPASVPTITFKYAKYKEDPEPTIFYMGQGIQPQSGRRIVGGLNLNYIRTRGPRAVEDVIRANIPILMKVGAIAAWPAPGNLQAAFEAVSRMLDNASGTIQTPARQILGYSPYASRGVYRTYLIEEMSSIRPSDPLTALSQADYQKQQVTRADQAQQVAGLAQAQTDQAKQIGRDQARQIAPDATIGEPGKELDLQLEPDEDEPLEVLDVDTILGPDFPQEPEKPEILDVDTILGGPLEPPESPKTTKKGLRTSPQRRRFR